MFSVYFLPLVRQMSLESSGGGGGGVIWKVEGVILNKVEHEEKQIVVQKWEF